MTTITVNDHEVVFSDGTMGELGRCYGNDWEEILSSFGLALPVDTWEPAATLTFRDVQGDEARRGSPYTNLSERDYATTVEFSSVWAKIMATRYYRIARRHGAPKIIARWMVSMECQRLISLTMHTPANYLPHLEARFEDSREEGEIESDNADEAVRILNDHTDGGSWGWEDGGLWLTLPDDEEE